METDEINAGYENSNQNVKRITFGEKKKLDLNDLNLLLPINCSETTGSIGFIDFIITDNSDFQKTLLVLVLGLAKKHKSESNLAEILHYIEQKAKKTNVNTIIINTNLIEFYQEILEKYNYKLVNGKEYAIKSI